MSRLQDAINNEVERVDLLGAAGNYQLAFRHLERAHVLGQASTYDHTRVHWRMLTLAIKLRSPREIWGQIIRLIGASTKTAFGIYPTGNTGRSNVWFFKPMPIADDLKQILGNGKHSE